MCGGVKLHLIVPRIVFDRATVCGGSVRRRLEGIGHTALTLNANRTTRVKDKRNGAAGFMNESPRLPN